MNWETVFKAKTVSAEEALKVVNSGDRVIFSSAAGESQTLCNALVNRADELEDVEIVHLATMGKAKYCRPGMRKHFLHNSLFVGSSTREAVNQGRADFTPCFFSEVPRLFREGYLPLDVALIHVSPPDKHGFMSLGISVDYTRAAAEQAKKVIAAVNPRMPRTLGDSYVHVSEIDYIVETDEPLIELPPPQINPVQRSIGQHVANLIEDGSTLQLGIGALPDAVLMCLKEKNDLGIHTEMFSDGVLELIETGVINNRAKTIHRGKMVATFLMGTRKLYDFVHNNSMVEMHPVDYTNDPFIVSQNNKMTAINSALEVDLTGQICAESIGYKQLSGAGGQMDFIRGACRSKKGKAIIAMPSTAAGGTRSRLVISLSEGAAVTTSRNDVHYVVTEYGAADLRGKSLRQRAEALVAIAHPDFRKELTEGTKNKRSIIFHKRLALGTTC